MDPLGLGHAVWCRKYIDDEPFAVLLADDLVMSSKPCLQQLIDAYNTSPGNIVAAMDVLNLTNRYGILDVEAEDDDWCQLKTLLKSPAKDAPSTLAITSIY